LKCAHGPWIEDDRSREPRTPPKASSLI
jgi:hypothetical protein